MIVRPLNTNERAEMPGFTHVAVITANDLTQVTAATAQLIDLCAVQKDDIVYRSIGVPVVPFQNTADAAFNSDTISFGDDGLITRHYAAAEANWNNGAGSGVNAVETMGNTAYQYTAAAILRLGVNSMAAKSLVNLNRGEYHCFFCLTRPSRMSNAIARTGPTKA
jgi:hypothetical protein